MKALLVMDERGIVRGLEGQGELFFGECAQSIIGQPISRILTWPQGSDPLAHSSAAGLHLAGHATPVEVLCLREKGAPLPAHLMVCRIDLPDHPLFLGFLQPSAGQFQEEQKLDGIEDFEDSLIQKVADGVVVEDREGHLTYVNAAAADLLGYAPSELIGMHWKVIVPPDQQAIVERADSRREHGESDRYELQLQRKDGERIHVLVSGSPRFENHRFAGTVAVFTDISEVKMVEQALRESEERFRVIVEGTQAFLVNVDVEGCFTYANEAAARALGFEHPRAILGESFLRFVHPDDRGWVNEGLIKQIQHGQRSAKIELRGVDRHGGVHWFSFVNHLIVEDGQVVGISAIAQDISAQKQTQMELQRKTRQQMLLMETVRYLTASLDFKEVLRRIGMQAKELLHAYGCAIYLLEPDGKTLTPVVSLEPEFDQLILSTPLDMETSFTGQAVKNRCALIFNEVSESEYGQHIPGTPEDEDERVIVAPFLAEGEVLGAMCLNRMGERFNQEDVDLADTFAAYAALALKNARMYHELQREVEERKRAEEITRRRNRELDLLNRLVLAAGTSTDLEVVLEVTCRELAQALGAPLAGAALLDEGGKQLKVVAEHRSPDDESLLGVVFRVADFPFYQEVLEGRLPVGVEDALHDPRLTTIHPLLGRQRVASLLMLPLAGRNQVLGVLGLAAREKRVFSEDEIALTATAAAAAGQAIETVRLFEETRRRAEELEALAEVSSTMRLASTQKEMFPIILNQVLYLFEADGAALALQDPASGDTVFELAYGRTANLTGRRLAPGEGVSGRVIATGEPFVRESLQGESGSLLLDQLGGGLPTACIPLIAQEKAIGALLVVRQDKFTANEVRLLTAICDMAANALHRSSLHEQTERRLQRLIALRTVDEAISASLDLRITLNVFLQQVTRQLGVDAAAVLMLDENLRTLNYSIGYGFATGAITRSHLRFGEGYAGRAALERRSLLVADIQDADPPFERAQLLAEEGFVAYCAVPLIAKGQVKGVLDLFQRTPLTPDSDWLDFLEALATQAAIAIDNAGLFDDLQRTNVELVLAYDTTIEGWARALELRDMETEGHSQRVTEMTLQLARMMGIPENELVHVRHGALLHDIGKMGVPDSILHKPGPLTEEEWAVMHQHPVYAFNLLSPINYLRPALDIPYCHHEKWDGNGYPRALKGEQIPLAARVFAVVDVWDALRSDRPYRKAWPEEKALAYIREQAGVHFDPRVVEAFLKLV